MPKTFSCLTDEQKRELNTLTTAEEVLGFARREHLELTEEEATEIAAMLPDDALEAAAGGVPHPPRLPFIY